MCTPVVFKVLKKANHYFCLLFKLYTPVNSYGNVGTASSLNHTFSQHKLTSTSAFYKENKKDNCYMTSIFTLIPGTVKYAFLPLREIIFVNNTYGALIRPKLPDWHNRPV